MNARQAIKLASTKKRTLCAILIHGVHVVISDKDAIKLESKGMAFGWLFEGNGKVQCIPNGND